MQPGTSKQHGLLGMTEAAAINCVMANNGTIRVQRVEMKKPFYHGIGGDFLVKVLVSGGIVVQVGGGA